MRGHSVLKSLTFVIALSLLVLIVAGCGSSGPTAAVESFMEAAQAKDCEKMVDLMDLGAIEAQGMANAREQLVASCKQGAEAEGEVTGYKITEEKVEEDRAEITVEVSTREGGEERTQTDTITVVKIDGEWKISIV